jgi:hypothetical protein
MNIFNKNFPIKLGFIFIHSIIKREKVLNDRFQNLYLEDL